MWWVIIGDLDFDIWYSQLYSVTVQQQVDIWYSQLYSVTVQQQVGKMGNIQYVIFILWMTIYIWKYSWMGDSWGIDMYRHRFSVLVTYAFIQLKFYNSFKDT